MPSTAPGWLTVFRTKRSTARQSCREVTDGSIDPDQAWFWTREWQTKESEADDDIAAGRATTLKSDDELLGALEADMKPLDAES